MSMPSVSLYESAARIQPRMAHGRYARLRVLAMCALLGWYYGLPWLSWNGAPAVLFDLPHRRFNMLMLHLAPQDLYLLSFLLMIAAMTLFLFTSLAGRLWCGYACPQTVWTEAFLWMERAIEGDRHARLQLDKLPWSSPRKLLRRGARHLAWIVFALYTGATFVAYFMPARELFPALAHLQLSGWPLFWVLFYGFATWGNAGFMREQVCKYMCPYARFQSAMFDRHTLIIAYDEKRGEPRKGLSKQLGKSAGSCVNCSLCVQVCPTGIDIRQGLQYECIACAACVDVCNTVMDAIHQPRGLIRYTSAAREAGGHTRVLRGRTIGYGIVWVVMCTAFLVAIALRSPLDFDVIRDRHSLYRELADERIENVYTVKLGNKDNQPHQLLLSARGAQGAMTIDPSSVTLQPGESRALTVAVRGPAPAEDEHGHGARAEPIKIGVQDADNPKVRRERETRFFGE
ncbi:MAG TPA: cytochrome c oxidase accessory protein CcoG [Nevskiaceae bacterium]|nr:cytochrome c oxidase accessory protein CcoG [Nevskiaceae bacterium]